MSNRPRPQPQPGDYPASAQQYPRPPLYLVRPSAADPAGAGELPADGSRGTASVGTDASWFNPVTGDGAAPAGQPVGAQADSPDSWQRAAYTGTHDGRQPGGTEHVAGMDPDRDQYHGDRDGPGDLPTRRRGGQLMRVDGPDVPDVPPSVRRVGMPWPRQPHELRPASPDLIGEIVRRPDAEIAPGERSAVADLRWAVVRRLSDITANHAEAAWRLRYSKPVSPNLMVLLFAVPFDYQGRLRFSLRADARTWHQSDRVADSAAVLQEMAALVHQGWRRHGPEFDVRAALTNQPDAGWTAQDLARRPEFVGVALSTLDTSEYGPWKRMQDRTRYGDDVPSEVLAQFTDGGRLRVMRHAGRLYHRIDRQASVSLNPDGQPPFLPWDSTPALNNIRRTDPSAYVWHFLAELTRAVYWGWPAWR